MVMARGTRHKGVRPRRVSKGVRPLLRHPSTLSKRPKGRAYVVDEDLGHFERREVAAFRQLAPPDEVELACDPRAWREVELAREYCSRHRHVHAFWRGWALRVTTVLVVEPRGGGDRAREPIDRDVRQDVVSAYCVFQIAVVLRPAVELLDDPGREASRGIVEADAQRLRFRALNLLIADLVRHARAPCIEARLLRVRDTFHRLAAAWRSREHEVQVDAFHVLGIQCAEPRRDRRAPIAALSEVARITELLHELGEHRRAGLCMEAGLVGGLRKSITRNRRTDDVERILRVAAVAFGLCERADHMHELGHRSGPTVCDQQWLCVRVCRTLMDEVKRASGYLVSGRRRRVETRQRRAEVELRAPVFAKLPQITDRRAVGPWVADLIGPACRGQPSSQVFYFVRWKIDGEWFHLSSSISRRNTVRVPAHARYSTAIGSNTVFSAYTTIRLINSEIAVSAWCFNRPMRASNVPAGSSRNFPNRSSNDPSASGDVVRSCCTATLVLVNDAIASDSRWSRNTSLKNDAPSAAATIRKRANTRPPANNSTKRRDRARNGAHSVTSAATSTRANTAFTPGCANISVSSIWMPSDAAAISTRLENRSTRSLRGSRICPAVITTPTPAGSTAISVPCATEITPFSVRASANDTSAFLSDASRWSRAT